VNNSPGCTSLRWCVYRLLITVATAAVCGRILNASSSTMCANDRSRWATVRALVDDGTYVIGHRDGDPESGQYRDSGIMTEPGWDTVDKVLRPDTQDFYSSKPPLLPTLVAGEYWLLKKAFGWSFTKQRWTVVRVILITVNAIPLAIYLALLALLVERFGKTDWGRLFVMTAGCFGTFLTTFAVVLNNHTVAACTALFALYPALGVWSEPPLSADGSGHVPLGRRLRAAWPVAVSGFFAGLTACVELPAASFAAALSLLLFRKAPGRTVGFFLPAAAVPIAAFLLTNYLAIGQLRPVYSEIGGPWYEFEGSYWKTSPGFDDRGIDSAGRKETKTEYVFHLLEGHHGLFSLSPIYLIGLASLFCGPRSCAGPGRKDPEPGRDRGSRLRPPHLPGLRLVVGLTLFLTLVVVGFYVIKSDNYGGLTSGPRWFFWLTPFWLLTMLPAADQLALRGWGRLLGIVLLAVSVVSVNYPIVSPWCSPWIFDFMQAQGWLPY
jgi:hypothetical protein